MNSMHDYNLQMIELTEEELSAVVGSGDGGFSPSPTIVAFSKLEATSFNFSANLSFSTFKKTNFFFVGGRPFIGGIPGFKGMDMGDGFDGSSW